MSKATPPTGENLPKAQIRRRKWRLPTIWVVPLVAAVVAGYLAYQHIREFGAVITIRFRSSGGLKPGQTPVQYRGAEIGRVTAVSLSEDQQYASVKVKLRRYATSLARDGSVFWIVRPQLGMGELTGLGTIVTGPYLEVLPGSGKPARQFVGAETSPLIIDPQGLTVVLLSNDGGSLRAGVPIYYRGIEVGVVRETRLSTNASAVEIVGVIRRRYAPLVRSQSKFWNVTGMDLHFGLFHGAEMNVESLKSLLIGGIAFATPDDPGPPPTPQTLVFRLYEQAQKEWLNWSPKIAVSPDGTEAQRPPVEAKPDLPLKVPQGQENQ